MSTADTAPPPSRAKPNLVGGDRHLGRRAPRPRRHHAKKQIRKVFPDHWSFMLGEIALWSFVVLLLTGVFLTLWFKPSMAEVDYNGSYEPLRGIPMSRGLRVDAEHLLRRPRRPADAADAPLGGDALHRRDVRPHDARLLHRRLPQAP